ncbi:MAG TPA: hypothetical protein VJ306_10880 [Pyrinomonadaceae bacterium]|nr:hypothetical protein [Pyrinomonadaceae bacterium]
MKLTALIALFFVFGVIQLQAQEPEPSAAQKYFTDTVLINQDGEKMRF